MKNRKEILAAALKEAVPKFDISLLTDQQLDDLEQVMKKNGLQYISIQEAVKNGFIVPENQEIILTELIKFYKQWKKTN